MKQPKENLKLGDMLENLRKKSPLIHNITNYVTVNDCANILLACGASPIMADEILEVEEITSICGGLNINIGTLNQTTLSSMLAAGKKANELKHPVVLDPVGAGASVFRTNSAKILLEEIKFSIVRGNISEIKALAYGVGTTRGVDADIADAITEEGLDSAVSFAKAFAKKIGSIIAITGAIDIVTDGNLTYTIRNGHPMMSKITGTGCMLSAMTAAYASSNPNNLLLSTASAVCAMGLCGERAYQRLILEPEKMGNLSYRVYLCDEIFRLDKMTLEKGAKYELR